ncbi:MAG: acyclic terpene utilization AtuA family protein, partial [Pseudomonadota bacterium]
MATQVGNAGSKQKCVKIGGAVGFWGESDAALPQFLRHDDIDYIVFDYLAEITMSIMARAKAADPAKGYAIDFVTQVLRTHIREVAAQDIKIIANAGGVNPEACAGAIRTLLSSLGVSRKVGVVLGDDLFHRRDILAERGIQEMFRQTPFPQSDKIASINAYLGAFPIAEALRRGADIVVTGRCVDSALTLGPCIYEFGWTRDDVDALAGGSLAGHIIECGPQATGGNFTDWEDVSDGLADIGYPIAHIRADGGFAITKAANTGGVVSTASVGEQMLYEIGDPSA